MLRALTGSKMIEKIIKFLIVGFISTLINYSAFALLYRLLNLNYLISSAAGYLIGLIAGYFMNKYWTFASQVEAKKRYFFMYLAVYTVSLISSLAFLRFLVETKIFNPLIANILAIALSTAMNFLGTNFIVFESKKRA